MILIHDRQLLPHNQEGIQARISENKGDTLMERGEMRQTNVTGMKCDRLMEGGDMGQTNGKD